MKEVRNHYPNIGTVEKNSEKNYNTGMTTQNNFMMNLSILYRNTQKYMDRVLAPYDIGSGQVIFLMFINENEGTTMQEVTRISEVDKGTTTKSVNRLIDQGYVEVQIDQADHRIKHLYTTEKCAGIMKVIYEVRNACRSALAAGIDFDQFEEQLDAVCENARKLTQLEQSATPVRIGRVTKTSLKDYPGKIVSTLYFAGCGMKCPYCRERDLVYIPDKYAFVNENEVLSFLRERKGILEGVVLSGGEPFLQESILPFLKNIKQMGYAIKVECAGSILPTLKEAVSLNLLDFISFDIKNTEEKYAMTTGLESYQLDGVYDLVSYIRECGVPYEFVTTVVKELHTEEDLIAIAKKLDPKDPYVLQTFVPCSTTLQEGFHAYTKDEMEHFKRIIEQYIENVTVR